MVASNKMLNRIIMALIFIPIIIVLIKLGSWPFLILISAIALVGLFEFYQLVKNKIRPLFHLGMVAGGVLLLSTFYDRGTFWPFLVITAAILVSFLWQMGRKELGSAITDCGVTILGLLYVVGLLSYLIILRKLENGESLVLTVWFITWIGDSGAFAIGKPLGRHRLLPRISPNKTIEGAVGGLVCSMIASLLTIKLFHSSFHLGEAILVGFILGLFGIMGDLSESLLKRSVELKDSGGKVPGHGGILDIFDSLLFTAPLMYYYAKFIMKL